MGSFLEKIAKRIANAKGGHSAVVDGLTMTGDTPNAIVINPDIQMRTEGFKSFLGVLTEGTKGADTAYSGHVNEHLTNHLIKKYVEHLNHHVSNGNDYDTAHAKGIDHITNQQYDENNTPKALDKAKTKFDKDEMVRMHEDSKKSAIAVVNHIKNNYGHTITGSDHIGTGSGGVEAKGGGGADLLVHTKNRQGNSDQAKAILEHVGASLKYSKKTASTIKIHSPSIHNMASIIDAHHKEMHGTSSGIHEKLAKIAEEGMQNQKNLVAPHHEFLQKEIARLQKQEDAKPDEQKLDEKTGKMKKVKKKVFSYNPVRDKKGNVVGGELSHDAVSHLRDTKHPSYTGMASENLRMKNKIASVMHETSAKVLDHHSDKPKEEAKHTATKTSLIRSMANLQEDQLPTFLVSTDRNKPEASIYDTGKFLTNNIASEGVQKHSYTGRSTFNIGPMNFSVDARPKTNGNPLNNPINTTIKTSDIKKQKEAVGVKPTKNTPSTVRKTAPPTPSAEPERHHTLFWGRANPPHSGHEQAYNVVKKVARQNGGTSSMVLSRTQDNKNNPLSPEQKEKHAKRAFPDVNTSVADPEHNGLLQQVSKFHEQGVTHLHMVAGSDQHKKYSDLINRYNGVKGAHGYYNFKNVTMHSAGERDPDSEGTAGVSATTQRMHASAGRNKEFAKNAPSTMKPGHVKELYNDVRSGMSGPSATAKKIIKKAN